MGDSWIVIPVIVGILILATLGFSQEASAQFYENEAYEAGLKVAVDRSTCFLPAGTMLIVNLGQILRVLLRLNWENFKTHTMTFQERTGFGIKLG